jgi:apolipoprotein N-acyltransferase
MKTTTSSQTIPISKMLSFGILLTGMIAEILLSPKWLMPVMAWIAPACLLFYFRNTTVKRKVICFLLAIVIFQIFGQYGVMPFPLAILVIASLIEAVKWLIVFAIDKAVTKRTKAFISTLIFPAAFVTKEFIDMNQGGGVWSSIANTQYCFSWLTQFSSVTGLIGISFMVYWFAAVAVWSIERYLAKESFRKGVLIYTGIFAAVMIFGASRLYTDERTEKHTVQVAGLTAPIFGVLEGLYKDVYHKNIVVDPTIGQTSKELQQVQSALLPFIENPDSTKFVNGYNAIYRLHDSLFTLSQQAASKGAKIIVWSEGNGFMLSYMQNAFIKRGEEFAAKNKVYLMMALAVFEPGKITPGKNFTQNKTVLISPDGRIANVFYKNHPVPFAEHSVPGNGSIPVIATPYGNISPSICYDADIPSTMRQLGKKKVDALFLPSGDWYNIAPYHSYMAMFRGIENGLTIVRPTSGGLSLVTDYRGKQQTSFDFYQPGEKLWTDNIITGHAFTLYSVIGDAFAYICVAITLGTVLLLVVQMIAKKKVRRKMVVLQTA